MHWCLYENDCTHNCFKDCPYSADMCMCCISVNWKDCIGCKYYKKGGDKNESKSTQENVENY